MTDEVLAAAPEKTPEQLRAEVAEQDAAQAEAARVAAAADQARLEAEAQAEQDTKATAAAITDPPREIPAAERLRAFEDELFGKEAVRINGQVERGSGSRFQLMTPGQRRHYEALEALRPAEVRLAEASAELIAAETAHEAALSTVEKTSEGI